MCIVIDMDVLSCVFNPCNQHHSDFSPVKEWVTRRNGFIVFGGTRYKSELRNARHYLGIFTELSRKGKVKQVNQELVDRHQQIVEGLLGQTRFNDPHLIAIIRVSGCRLVCSKDQEADKHLKNKRYYLPNQKPPSIYRSRKHAKLLINQNIVKISNSS